MGHKKYLALGLSGLLLAQAASVSAFQGMDASTMGMNIPALTNMPALTNAADAASSADATESGDSEESDGGVSNGDAVVTDGEAHNGDYTVNGDLRVEGVLYVFGNLDVNGDLTIAKDAKLRVTKTLSVNGDVKNEGGNVYAKKREITGGTSGTARKLDSEVAKIDALLAASVTGEEREAIIRDILDSQKAFRAAVKEKFLDDLEAKIQEEDVADFAKVRKTLLDAFKRKLLALGGVKENMLDAFAAKFASMPTDKLETFVTKVEKLQSVTKRKRFIFQLSQLKDMAEEELQSRVADETAPTVETPVATSDSGSTAAVSASGTVSASSSGSVVDTASGSTSATSSGTTASGSTSAQ